MAYQKSKYLIVLFLLALALAAAAAKKAEKYPPISGEIYGQTVRGVKAITVNNRAVAIDGNNNFRTTVSLKSGEKYLTLKINYGSFVIVKKYEIIRKAQVKTFKVFVPKEKIQRPVEEPAKQKVVSKKAKRRILAQSRLRSRLAKTALKPKPPKAKRGSYQYVWEFSPGKLLLVKRIKGVYSADIFIPARNEWFELSGISSADLREISEEPLPILAEEAASLEASQKP